MKITNLLSICILLLAQLNSAFGQDSAKVKVGDFNMVSGTWYGKLTYLDYSSGKPYSMQANITISRIKNTNQFIFSNAYPKEPNANSTDTVTISTDGKMIDQEKVISRTRNTAGNLEIITEVDGKDGNDNKPATIRHTYVLGMNDFVMRKDVKFIDSNEWIRRHEYAYQREL